MLSSAIISTRTINIVFITINLLMLTSSASSRRSIPGYKVVSTTGNAEAVPLLYPSENTHIEYHLDGSPKVLTCKCGNVSWQIAYNKYYLSTCDVCSKSIPFDDPMRSCKGNCNWNMCMDCVHVFVDGHGTKRRLISASSRRSIPGFTVRKISTTCKCGGAYRQVAYNNTCDICRKIIPKNWTMHSCRKCNWDMCMDCVNNTPDIPSAATTKRIPRTPSPTRVNNFNHPKEPKFFPMKKVGGRSIVREQLKYLEKHGASNSPLDPNKLHRMSCGDCYFCKDCMEKDVTPNLPAILKSIPSEEAKEIIDYYNFLKAVGNEPSGRLVKAIYTGLQNL